MDELDLILTDGHLAQEIGADRAAVIEREELRQYRPVGSAPQYLVYRVGRVLGSIPVLGYEPDCREYAARTATLVCKRLRERESGKVA